ncbi:MAG: hypothetical protein IT435_19915 [Phycisphaerales bacterium]|nr:hypothetical protein [Phycisphaerales bacterium]
MPREIFPEGDRFTKQQLLEVSGLSSKTFDMIRKAARVKGPPHGGLNWVFPRADVEILIERAASGRFTERGPPAAAAWRALLDGELGNEAEDDDEEP